MMMRKGMDEEPSNEERTSRTKHEETGTVTDVEKATAEAEGHEDYSLNNFFCNSYVCIGNVVFLQINFCKNTVSLLSVRDKTVRLYFRFRLQAYHACGRACHHV